MKATPAGQKPHLVYVQQPTRTYSPISNEPIDTWATFAHAWAKIETIGSMEVWREAQVQPEATHGVTLSYVPGLTRQMRLEHRGRLLNILSVIDKEEREIEHLLQCKEEST